MADENKQDCVQRAKGGEAAAIAELFKRYWRAARAAAYGVTGELALAEDAASEAFFAAINDLELLEDNQKFGPWLHTIVVRTAKRLIAKAGKETPIEAEALTCVNPRAQSDELERRELAALVHEAVTNLSQSQREAISLFYFEGYTIEEGARFLDIPAGTFKRRLHDGRRRLRDAGERIVEGRKGVNMKRGDILARFREVIEGRASEEERHEVLREVLKLRPLPYEMIAEFLKKHSNVAKKLRTVGGTQEVQQRSRKVMQYLGRASERAKDPEHPLGKTLYAIKTALPEFREWQIDMDEAAAGVLRRLAGDDSPPNLPPGFAEGKPGAYMYQTRGTLVRMRDGAMRTWYEVMQRTNTKEQCSKAMKEGGCVCDVLVLTWMKEGAIELQEVEELLRRLAGAIAPEVKISFASYDEPAYRSALRMEFEGAVVPAAIGGPAEKWRRCPEGVSTATVQLYLEAWAAAYTGQAIEPPRMSGLLDKVGIKAKEGEQ
jgi:RNA polymerase sigma factor (sigma-70 family)